MAVGEPDPLKVALGKLEKSSGDAEAWADVFREAWPYVLGLSLSFVRHSGGIAAAEDVAQEVFYSLSRALHEGRLRLPRSAGELYKLLTVMTRNQAADTLRWERRHKRDARRHIDLDLVGDALMVAANGLGDEVESVDIVNELLGRLSPFERTVLALRLSGHSTEDIAKRVKMSSRTVRRHLRLVGSELSSITAERQRKTPP